MAEQNNELTLHIVIATIPRHQEEKYPQDIKENFYDNYISESKNYYSNPEGYYTHPDKSGKVNVIYNPLKYYLFGNYDIAFISLADSYKFAQRLFMPKPGEPDSKPLNPNSFQILTGIISEKTEPDYLRDFFYKRLQENPVTSTFIGICNLKLNNGLLAGNGHLFYKMTIDLIRWLTKSVMDENKEKREPDDFIILQSFSWFEISLILFVEDPNIVSKVLTKLRRKRISDLESFGDLNRALSGSIYAKEKDDLDKIKNSHIFADTHTYFGVNCDEFIKPDFMNRFTNQQLELRTEVEWQIKPGHLPDLIAEITEHFDKIGVAKDDFNLTHPYLLTGKTDYYIPQKADTNFGNTHRLFRIFRDKNYIYDYVKKIKTNVQFDHVPPDDDEDRKPVDLQSPQRRFREQLKLLAISPDQIELISKQLKALKISRQIRSKVTKIFYNYNNGIQDSILFVYFIDFSGYIDALIKLIERSYHLWVKIFSSNNVNVLEDRRVGNFENELKNMISIFEEAYSIRMLNCYQFEDISDFDLDFNSSIQQLLTTYTSLATTVVNLFYSNDFQYVPVIQLNYNVTEANYHSINYNVYHLISPEFVFFTIAKEVLNQYKNDDRQAQQNLQSIKSGLYSAFNSIKLFREFLQVGDIDFDYLYIDAIRFHYTTNLDFELFSYWFWMYNFQNASMYEKIGIISEQHFKKELFRLMFLGKMYNFDVPEKSCPIPEVQNYWDKNYYEIKARLSDLFSAPGFDKVAASLKAAVITRISVIDGFLTEVPEKETLSISELWKQNLPQNNIKTKILEEKIESNFNKNLLMHYETRLGFTAYQNRYKALEYFHGSFESYLENGESILYDEKIYLNNNLFINALMYSYLKLLFQKNKGVVHLLRRNWETGEPLTPFIKNWESHFYSVDQTGGTFFYSPQMLNEYFKIRNGMLQSLWHFALIEKKTHIETYISKKQKQQKDGGQNN